MKDALLYSPRSIIGRICHPIKSIKHVNASKALHDEYND